MRRTEPLSVFVGSNTSVNVRHILDNFGSILSEKHHLISTSSTLTTTNFTTFGTDNPDSLLGGIQALSDYLQSHNPRALLQITDPPVHGTITGVFAKHHDIPFVYRYSGDRFYEYKVSTGRDRLVSFTLGSILGRVPIQLATQYIALGPVGKRRLIARGVNPSRITILPPVIDLSRFDEPDQLSLDIPSERHQILFVGRVSKLKGAKTLERVIPRVLDNRDDLHFVFVGDVQHELIVPETVRNHITYCGQVPPVNIADYMSTADLLVHPSLTEGVPRVLLESLAVGTPVLARDVGDVGSVTDNTFCTDDELVEQLISLENVALDDVTPFTRKRLTPAYERFFKQLARDL